MFRPSHSSFPQVNINPQLPIYHNQNALQYIGMTKESYVFAIVATSQDGYISPAGKEKDASTDWTSKEDFEYFRKQTKGIPCIMGSKTFDTIFKKLGKPLPGRLNVIHTRHPEKYADLDPNQVLTTSMPPKQVIKQLLRLGNNHIAVCGGHNIYDQYVLSGVVDQVHQTIESVKFGEGVPFLSEEALIRLKLAETIHLSKQTLVNIYNVIK